METLDNIIEQIEGFDCDIIDNNNTNDIFNKISKIIMICEKKIMDCASKIDNEITTPIKIEADDESANMINEMMEIAKKREEAEPKKKKSTKRTKKDEDEESEKPSDTEEQPKKRNTKKGTAKKPTTTKRQTNKKSSAKETKTEDDAL